MRIDRTKPDSERQGFHVTFATQGYFLPSRYNRRLTGWQSIYGAEWTTQEEAAIDRNTRLRKTDRYYGLRTIKRIHLGNATVIEVFTEEPGD